MNRDQKVLEELFDVLKAIRDDKDYIIGVLSSAVTLKEREALLEFIDKGEDVDDETIAVMAMNLADLRKKG